MTESEQELKVGDRIAERYEIQAIVGRGRMGTVYKCRHDVLGRVVAIKTLQLGGTNDDRMQRRFEREARLASRMEHPNLINVSDFGYTKNGDPYLVMDYVDGTQLYEILNRERCLDSERTISLFMQICDGLYHAHQRDIMHRDLKPANILVTKDGDGVETVKIVDLGVAKMIQHDEAEDQAITKAGEVCGSPVYLSPEQCLYLDLDSRTDIYSLGVCLYECLTGQPPLRGSTIYDTLKMHVHEIPLSFSIVAPQLDIPKKLEAVVFRCLEKDPNSRYETMMQVKHELMRSRKSEFDVVSVNVLPPQSLFPPGGKRKTSEISAFLAKRPGEEHTLPAGVQPDVAAANDPAAALPLIGQAVSPPRELAPAPGELTSAPRARTSRPLLPQSVSGMQESATSMRDSGQFVQMPDPSSSSAPFRHDGSSVQSAVTAQQSGPTVQQSGATAQQSGPSMQQSGASMQQSGSLAQQLDQSTQGSDSSQHQAVDARGQSMANPIASERQAKSVQNSTYDDEAPESQSPEARQRGRTPKSKKSRLVSGRGDIHEQAKNHAATDQIPSKNQSSPGKMIAFFVAACLAVGLSMGVGFATFVNKNPQTPSAQPQAPILQQSSQPLSQQSQLSPQQGKLTNSALVPMSKKAGAKSASPAKKATPDKNATPAKSGKNTAQVAKKVAPKATPSKHNSSQGAQGFNHTGGSVGKLPHEPTRPGKVSHENGVKIIRHADGTVDVYDSN